MQNGDYYYFYDALGSVRTITDSSGNVEAKYVYRPFGQVVDDESDKADWNDYLFTGQAYDDATDLIYLRARHYDPASGRFTARDTFEGSRNDPLTLHRYAYCANDPVNRIDPSGRSFLTDLNLSMSLRLTMFGMQYPTLARVLVLATELAVGSELVGASPNTTRLLAAEAERIGWRVLQRHSFNQLYRVRQAVGARGPDGIASRATKNFVIEIKGTVQRRLIGLLGKLKDGVMQLSPEWCRRGLRAIANSTHPFAGYAERMADLMERNPDRVGRILVRVKWLPGGKEALVEAYEVWGEDVLATRGARVFRELVAR